MSEQEKSTKTCTVQTIVSFSDQIHEASYLIKFDEFSISNGAAFKNGRYLDNICFKEVLGKDINWFAETYTITTIKTLKDPFYNKGLPSIDLLSLPNL